MNLIQIIEQYIAYRRSLGELQGSNGRTLLAFGRAIGADADIADVNAGQVEAFLAGSGPRTLNWHIKLKVLRPFYRFAVSRGYVDTVPLPVVVPKQPPAFVPYIFSQDDLRRLLHAADSDQRPQACMEPVTMRTILLLLYGTGLRLQEAVDLNRADVDLDSFVLTVHQTKFGKTRLVPVAPALGQALTQYAARPQPSRGEAAFFTTRFGTRINSDTLRQNHRVLCACAGVSRSDGARYQPRLHDLRHTFAVHRLTSWYRNGADVQRLLPLLAVYLGHVHIRSTQIYLSMTPALLHEASQRFERYADKEVSHV